VRVWQVKGAVRTYRGGINFAWEQIRGGKRGGKRAIEKGRYDFDYSWPKAIVQGRYEGITGITRGGVWPNALLYPAGRLPGLFVIFLSIRVECLCQFWLVRLHCLYYRCKSRNT
jgi:hypothetical protein